MKIIFAIIGNVWLLVLKARLKSTESW
jgi:hypothetical protein